MAGLATELGMGVRTIAAALSKVPPDGTIRAGHDGWYLLTALQALGCQLNVRGHQLSSGRGNGQGGDAYVRSRTTLASERAQLLKLKREEAQGRLAPIEDLADCLRTVLGGFRASALALPTSLAPRMVMLRTAGEAKAILDERVRDMLLDLAGAKIRAHPPGRKVPPGWQNFVDWTSCDGGPD